MATVAAENGHAAASASSVWAKSGLPAQGKYCLGRSAPSRVPRPAATTTRATVSEGTDLCSGRRAVSLEPGGRGVNLSGRERLDSLRPRVDHSSTRVEDAHAAQADRRQQGLLVMVAEALDPARPFREPVRGGRYPDGPARNADRQMPFAARRKNRGVGVAG